MASITYKFVLGIIATILFVVLISTSHDGIHIRYFPGPSMHPLEEWHYTRHLKAMEFPALLPDGKSNNYLAVRVLILPTFEEPVAIQYEYVGGILSCRSVILSGKGGYEPGRIIREQNARLDTDSLIKLKQAIKNSDLWKTPQHEDHKTLDGTSHVTELVQNGKRHVWVQSIGSTPNDLFSGEFIGVGCWKKDHRGNQNTFDGYIFRN